MPETALERQIRSQPDELERLASHPIHDAVERLAQCRRIWLVGTGTSLHAAELGAGMLHEAGRGAHAVPSMQFLDWAPPVDPRDGLVLISHNAGEETAFAAAAYRQAKDAGLRVLALCRQEAGLPDSIETVPKETSETYTVSYTAVLLLLARIANGLGAASLAPQAVAKVPAAVRAAIENPGTAGVGRPGASSRSEAKGPVGHRPGGSAEAPCGRPDARRGLRRRVPPGRDGRPPHLR